MGLSIDIQENAKKKKVFIMGTLEKRLSAEVFAPEVKETLSYI
jgi:hypothetical protein